MAIVVPKEGFVVMDKESASSDSHLRLQPHFPDFTIHVKDFFKSREAREFLSGALAGAMTKAVLAPLETIRTRMIVGVGSRSITGSFVEVIQKQWWQGLWAGNEINMIRIIPTQAIELGTFEWVKRAMTSAQQKLNKVKIGDFSFTPSISWLSPVAVAGAFDGIATTLVCHPHYKKAR